MDKKDIDVKTTLTWPQYQAMQKVVNGKGLTTAGYVRNLILLDILSSQDLVSQIVEITERAKIGNKREV